MNRHKTRIRLLESCCFRDDRILRMYSGWGPTFTVRYSIRDIPKVMEEGCLTIEFRKHSKLLCIPNRNLVGPITKKCDPTILWGFHGLILYCTVGFFVKHSFRILSEKSVTGDATQWCFHRGGHGREQSSRAAPALFTTTNSLNNDKPEASTTTTSKQASSTIVVNFDR